MVAPDNWDGTCLKPNMKLRAEGGQFCSRLQLEASITAHPKMTPSTKQRINYIIFKKISVFSSCTFIKFNSTINRQPSGYVDMYGTHSGSIISSEGKLPKKKNPLTFMRVSTTEDRLQNCTQHPFSNLQQNCFG